MLKEALGVQEPSVKEAYSRGYRRGSRGAQRTYRVDYRCSVCGGTLTITSEEEKKAVAEYMRENGWAHRHCLEDS